LACDLLVGEELLLPAQELKLEFLAEYQEGQPGASIQDENVHLYPVASEKKGIFFVGGCRGDSDIGRVLQIFPAWS
jgi:hypothetical protein